MGLEIGFFIGAVVLLAAIVWGATANTRRNRANAPITAAATKEVFQNPDGDESKQDKFREQLR